MLRDRRGEQGTSVAEFVVTCGLLVLVLAVVTTAMLTMHRRLVTAGSRSETNDAVRLAIEELDRQVRSGNVIHDPGADTPQWMSLRIYTQSNATTASTSDRCVQWRVLDGRLQVRQWTPDYDAATGTGTVTEWRTVTEHLQNEAAGEPAFKFDTSQESFGGRIVKVRLVLNRDSREGSDNVVEASITGRNVQFGHPRALCAEVPA